MPFPIEITGNNNSTNLIYYSEGLSIVDASNVV